MKNRDHVNYTRAGKTQFECNSQSVWSWGECLNSLDFSPSIWKRTPNLGVEGKTPHEWKQSQANKRYFCLSFLDSVYLQACRLELPSENALLQSQLVLLLLPVRWNYIWNDSNRTPDELALNEYCFICSKKHYIKYTISLIFARQDRYQWTAKSELLLLHLWERGER